MIKHADTGRNTINEMTLFVPVYRNRDILASLFSLLLFIFTCNIYFTTCSFLFLKKLYIFARSS